MATRKARLLLSLLGLLAATVLDGCEDSSVGTLNVDIQGAALVDTQNVVLAVKAVDVGGDGGQTDIAFPTEELVDLDAGRAVLTSALVPQGDYRWVRLEVNAADSYVIAANGGRYPLSTEETYQASQPYTVGRGQTVTLVVSMDPRKALEVQSQGNMPVYTLQPILRMTNLATARQILGTAPTSLMIGSQSITDPACEPELYVYQGAGVTPQGFFVPVNGGTAPFTSAGGVLRVSEGLYTFDVTLIPSGTYTAAVTCAATDVPGATRIAFSPTQTTVVTVDTNGSVTF